MENIRIQIRQRICNFYSDVQNLRTDTAFKIDQSWYNIPINANLKLNLFSQEMVAKAKSENLILVPFFTNYHKRNIFTIRFIFGKIINEINAGEILLYVYKPCLPSENLNGNRLIEIDGDLLIYRSDNSVKYWFVKEKTISDIGENRVFTILKILKSFSNTLEERISSLGVLYLSGCLLNDFRLVEVFFMNLLSENASWKENKMWLVPELNSYWEEWKFPKFSCKADLENHVSAERLNGTIEALRDAMKYINFDLPFTESGCAKGDFSMLWICCIKEIQNILKSSMTGVHSFLNRRLLEIVASQNPVCLAELKLITKNIMKPK